VDVVERIYLDDLSLRFLDSGKAKVSALFLAEHVGERLASLQPGLFPLRLKDANWKFKLLLLHRK